jgi:putative salt-induced outer membrane protein
MNFRLLSLALVAAMPLVAHAADDDGWKGSGELGLAASRGNSRSENLNAKLDFTMEDDTWKDHFYATALRSKGEIKVTTVDANGQPVQTDTFQLTANRYELGASVGYKFDERSYVVGALRYENDDFSPFEYQEVLSLGYGYTAIKNERTELALEIGPGYKRSKATGAAESQGEAVGRGLIAFKHKISENTAFEDTFLVEAGSDNQFLQNDAGLVVSMNDRLALKVGHQARRNSDVTPGTSKTDQVLTTNVAYKF